jgi:hypothetical protein
MKCIAPAIALSLVALTAETALASKYDFTAYNDSGFSIVSLYVSESWLDTWRYDFTGSTSLPSGYNTGILELRLETYPQTPVFMTFVPFSPMAQL